MVEKNTLQDAYNYLRGEEREDFKKTIIKSCQWNNAQWYQKKNGIRKLSACNKHGRNEFLIVQFELHGLGINLKLAA